MIDYTVPCAMLAILAVFEVIISVQIALSVRKLRTDKSNKQQYKVVDNLRSGVLNAALALGLASALLYPVEMSKGWAVVASLAITGVLAVVGSTIAKRWCARRQITWR